MAPAGWTDQVPVPRQHSNAAWAKVAPGRPDGGQPPTPVGAVSRFLLSRADHELVDGDATRARHTVLEDIADVLRSELLEAGEALHDVLTHLFPYRAQVLSRDGPRLDHRDAHGSRTTSDYTWSRRPEVAAASMAVITWWRVTAWAKSGATCVPFWRSLANAA